MHYSIPQWTMCNADCNRMLILETIGCCSFKAKFSMFAVRLAILCLSVLLYCIVYVIHK